MATKKKTTRADSYGINIKLEPGLYAQLETLRKRAEKLTGILPSTSALVKSILRRELEKVAKTG